MTRQITTERRGLITAALEHARKMWGYGRSDRVAGLPMAITFQWDLHYRAGYEGERRKEIVPGTDQQST